MSACDTCSQRFNCTFYGMCGGVLGECKTTPVYEVEIPQEKEDRNEENRLDQNRP